MWFSIRIVGKETSIFIQNLKMNFKLIYSERKQINGCLRMGLEVGSLDGKDLQGHRKYLGMMAIFTILIVVMV